APLASGILPQRVETCRSQYGADRCRNRQAPTIAPREPGGAIQNSLRPRQHRRSLLVPAQVFRELLRRTVAVPRLPCASFGEDARQIAFENARQFRRRLPARARCAGGYYGGGPCGIDLSNRPLQAGDRRAGISEWPRAREQLIQHDPERIYVRRGGDGLAAHLLRAG